MEYLVFVLIVALIVFMISAIYYMNKSNKQEKKIEEQKKEESTPIITYIDPNDPALRSDEANEEPKSEGEFPYLLTQSIFSPKEKLFYQALKPIADELGLLVFTKMRIADLLYIPKNTKDYIKWFNYIKAKHIDFILVNAEMQVKLLIEVDDKSHNGQKR